MLIRIGQCEAEVKVAALMSTPRLGFTDNFFCVAQALAPHRISPVKFTGAFWGQCLQNSLEDTIDNHDVIVTFDYDTIFTAKTLEALMTLLMYSGADALAPLQTKRESNTVMFALPGATPEEKTGPTSQDGTADELAKDHPKDGAKDSSSKPPVVRQLARPSRVTPAPAPAPQPGPAPRPAARSGDGFDLGY